MPTATKRRKLSTALRNPSSFPNNARGIDAFSKVSKGSSTAKAVIKKINYFDTIAITPPSTSDRKRKVAHSEEDNEAVSELFSAAITQRSIKPLPQRHNIQSIPQTPQKPILSQESPASIETPTKGARNLLDRFCITSKTPTRSSLGFNKSSSGILESKPDNTYKEIPKQLPAEIIDLINLHAAFLTALSIHCAHNGTHSPADLRNLCPNVARAWGKRRVTLDDIRRTLAIMNRNLPEGSKNNRISRLSLSDYGHGKICIEIRTSAEKGGKVARPVNENLLNEVFVRGLDISWEEKDPDMPIQEFVDNLPLEPITTCLSMTKMSPLLAKGQRRLEDLKAGIVVKKETAKEKTPETSDGRKFTLLERLRAKQLHQSTLPPPPSKAELARKAALQRIDEVVAVLTILSTSSSIGQQRISFTLPTVLGKLRDSFKTPMSKEEGATCVRLLVSEIAPEWLKIVKMGKVEALVVNRDEKPVEEEIRERVRRAVCTA